MKKVVYNLLAALLLPIILVSAIIYAASSAFELLFRTINLGFGYFMVWIEQNITPNIR